MPALPEIKPYPANPDYGVTRCGRVFRIRKARFGRHVPYELASVDRANGYLSVSLASPEGARIAKVHRMVAETFLPPAPGGATDVAHRDGTRTNNHVSNLYWATRRQNMADAIRHGRTTRGERQPTSKLTTPQVRAIKASRARGVDLAALYGVAECTICDIRAGRRWAHV